MDNGYSSSSSDDGCCSASTDCVNNSVCYDTGDVSTDIDGDGDTDYCNAGTWYDCNTNAQCNGICQSNDCIDGYATITINLPANTYNTSNPSITFNATVVGEPALSNVSIWGNWSGSWVVNETNTSGRNNTHYIFTKTLAAYSDGIYKWTYRACPSSGACSFATENRTLTLDRTPPVFSGHAINPNPPNEDQNVQINATITDSGVGIINTVILQLTNNTNTINYTVTTKSGSIYYITIGSGNYTAHDTITYKWFANDSVGNLNVSTQQSFTVANQAPAITVNEPDGSGDGTKTTFAVTWTATDNDNEDTSTLSCYGDADGTGYDKTYTCFTGSTNDGTESCDVSGWADNTYYIWCNATDGYSSGTDYSPNELTVDNTAPTPNPATISLVSSSSYSSMATTATTASDAGIGGIQYLFNETTGGSGATNGSWQSSASYTDEGLAPNTSYCYIVQYRDSLNNSGTWSSQTCNYTLAEAPSITQVLCGGETGDYECNVTISMGSNPSGTTNYIDETTGHSGGTDRSWSTSTGMYEDTGLAAETQYCYTIKARNGNNIETTPSSTVCGNTLTLAITETLDPDLVYTSSNVYVYGK